MARAGGQVHARKTCRRVRGLSGVGVRACVTEAEEQNAPPTHADDEYDFQGTLPHYYQSAPAALHRDPEKRRSTLCALPTHPRHQHRARSRRVIRMIYCSIVETITELKNDERATAMMSMDDPGSSFSRCSELL